MKKEILLISILIFSIYSCNKNSNINEPFEQITSSLSISPTPKATPTPKTTPKATPTPTKIETTSLSGNVTDEYGNSLNSVLITAEAIGLPNNNVWKETTETINGLYTFPKVPIDTVIKITASKDGWLTAIQSTVLKKNLTNTLNFDKTSIYYYLKSTSNTNNSEYTNSTYNNNYLSNNDNTLESVFNQVNSTFDFNQAYNNAIKNLGNESSSYTNNQQNNNYFFEKTSCENNCIEKYINCSKGADAYIDFGNGDSNYIKNHRNLCEINESSCKAKC